MRGPSTEKDFLIFLKIKNKNKMDDPKVGYNNLVGNVFNSKPHEPIEPTNYHKNEVHEEGLRGVERLSANILADAIIESLEKGNLKICVNDSAIKIKKMGIIYEMIRTSGKIRSITLYEFSNGGVIQRDRHELDAIKLLKYVTHYNKNVNEIVLNGFDLDIFLLAALFKIKTMTQLTIKNGQFSRDVFFVLIVCLFEDRNRIEYLNKYFNNLIEGTLYNRQKRAVSNLLSDINDLPNSNLKSLSINCSIVPVYYDSLYKNTSKESEQFDNAVIKMLETNCHLRFIDFPIIPKLLNNITYENALESNYSILRTNLSHSSLVRQRNERILETTRKSCLTLIGIKKFRRNNSPEFKKLALLDNNIVRMIGQLIYPILNNHKSHLTIMASKL